MPEEPGASEGVAGQQDKELSLAESQLHRSTPIVVLQPDSRVGCTLLLPVTYARQYSPSQSGSTGA